MKQTDRTRYTAWIFGMILIHNMLCACGRIQYVPMQTILKDSIVFTRIDIDSVVYRDSIFIDRSRDTIFKYVERKQLVWKFKSDTLIADRTDSVPVPYPVERELTRSEQCRMAAGTYVLPVMVLLLFALLYRIIKSRDNR
ncbi:MAG: hypothetical protein ACI30I_07370 [Parabacteroides sp.]